MMEALACVARVACITRIRASTKSDVWTSFVTPEAEYLAGRFVAVRPARRVQYERAARRDRERRSARRSLGGVL